MRKYHKVQDGYRRNFNTFKREGLQRNSGRFSLEIWEILGMDQCYVMYYPKTVYAIHSSLDIDSSRK